MTELMIRTILKDGDEIWLGLQYKSGSFMWFGNYASYNYSNWAQGEPSINNETQCFTLKRFNQSASFWYSRKCTDRYGTICQRCMIL